MTVLQACSVAEFTKVTGSPSKDIPAICALVFATVLGPDFRRHRTSPFGKLRQLQL